MNHCTVLAADPRHALQWREADVGRAVRRDKDVLATLLPDERVALDLIRNAAGHDLAAVIRRLAGAEILRIGRDCGLGDQAALEALIRSNAEDAPDRPVIFWFERAMSERDEPQERLHWPPVDASSLSLGKRIWAVMALSLHLEPFATAHVPRDLVGDPARARAFKDVLLSGWRAEIHHTLLDELTTASRATATALIASDLAVDRLVLHASCLDAALRTQASRDAALFARTLLRGLSPAEVDGLRGALLVGYRHRYLLSGSAHAGFRMILSDLLSAKQLVRVSGAFAALA